MPPLNHVPRSPDHENLSKHRPRSAAHARVLRCRAEYETAHTHSRMGDIAEPLAYLRADGSLDLERLELLMHPQAVVEAERIITWVRRTADHLVGGRALLASAVAIETLGDRARAGAEVYAGDTDSGLRSLEQMVEGHHALSASILASGMSDKLADEPRFQARVRRVGIAGFR